MIKIMYSRDHGVCFLNFKTELNREGGFAMGYVSMSKKTYD